MSRAHRVIELRAAELMNVHNTARPGRPGRRADGLFDPLLAGEVGGRLRERRAERWAGAGLLVLGVARVCASPVNPVKRARALT